VFGYRNVDVTNGTDQHGRALRSHVTRVIDETESRVVVRIFELYASGLGLKAIAKRLTSEGAAHPKPFRRKDSHYPCSGSWREVTEDEPTDFVQDPRRARSATAAAVVFSCDQLSMPLQQGVGLTSVSTTGRRLKERISKGPLCPRSVRLLAR